MNVMLRELDIRFLHCCAPVSHHKQPLPESATDIAEDMASTDAPSRPKDDEADTIEEVKKLAGEEESGAKKSELDNLGIWATVKRFKKASRMTSERATTDDN